MKNNDSVSVKSNSHNRDINQKRLFCTSEDGVVTSLSNFRSLKKYHLFFRKTCGDVSIFESPLTASSPQSLSIVFREVVAMFDNWAEHDRIKVAISRFYCSRYKVKYPFIVGFLTDLSYLHDRFNLDPDDFVLAYCIFPPFDEFAGSTRVDFIVRPDTSIGYASQM